MNESIGVSTVLTPMAAALLVSAADRARTLPVESLQRAKIIATAENKARNLCPYAFRRDDDCDSGRQRRGNR